MDFINILKKHLSLYPLMKEEDIVKLAYQSAFGAAHFSGDLSATTKSIAEEMTVSKTCKTAFEDIGEAVRLELSSPVAKALGARLVARAFVFSAKNGNSNGKERFLRYINEALPFANDTDALLSLASHALNSPPSHSEIYKKEYEPHYRVISKKYARALYAAVKIKEATEMSELPIVIAVDGPCASGKSTVASLLSYMFDADVIKADDFFLPPEKKTPERLSEPGGNIDRERFECEIIRGIMSGEAFTYRAYSCFDGSFSEKAVSGGKNIIVEGSYSMRPEFRKAYDICLYSDAAPEICIERLRVRNPEKLNRFIEEWIPLETEYFDFFGIKEAADYIIPNDITEEQI